MQLVKPEPISLSGATFTRASTATYLNSAGYLASAAINELRPLYAPYNNLQRGILIEPASTNLATYSEDFTNAAWTVSITNCTVTANTTNSPFNAAGADSLLQTTAAGEHYLFRNFAGLTTGQTYTYSIFVKKNNVSTVRLMASTDSAIYAIRLNMDTGIVITDTDTSAGTIYHAVTKYVTNGWYRLEITVTGLVGTSIRTRIQHISVSNETVFIGVATNGIYLFGAQLEQLDRSSSYIPATGASSVTRSADSITGSGLIYTTAVNTDANYSSGTTYAIGNRVSYVNKVYESLQNSNTNHQPDTSATWWLEIGADNKTACFDDFVSTSSSASGNLVSVVRGSPVDSVTMMNVVGNSVEVTVQDMTSGDILFSSVSGLISDDISDWSQYFFYSEDTEPRTQLIHTDLPTTGYSDLLYMFSFRAAVTASVGHIVLGNTHSLGVTSSAPKVGITDYSKKVTDEYGNTYLAQGRYSKKMQADVFFNNYELNRVVKLLTALRATPCVWIGSTEALYEEALVVFGYYKDFSVTIPYPSNSLCSLEIEGLT